MSRLRPHTVKASLSDEEKKAIIAIAKRHEMNEAELIRFVLCNADDLDIDFGLAEIADQKSRTEELHIRVSPEEKRIIESNADFLGVTVSSYARRVLINGKIEKIDFDHGGVEKIYHELLKQGTNLNQLAHFINAQGLSAYDETAVLMAIGRVAKSSDYAFQFLRTLERRYFTDGGDAK